MNRNTEILTDDNTDILTDDNVRDLVVRVP